MNEKTEIPYGVDYKRIDPAKKSFQELGLETLAGFRHDKIKELSGCRGESCYVLERPDCYVGFVTEALGTRCLVADAVYAKHKDPRVYHPIGWSAFAVIANDLATSGISLTASQMLLATGANEWFNDKERLAMFARGWTDANLYLKSLYGGGETPMLRDIILPDAFVSAGSAIGFLEKPAKPVRSENVRPGDIIVVFRSSGVHDNGLTLCRDIAETLPEKYDTFIEEGLTFGDALLKPTVLYGGLVRACMENKNIEIHSTGNISGHAWAKIMRALQKLEYVIEFLPEPHSIFHFLAERGNVSFRNLYLKFNMGAGYFMIVPRKSASFLTAVAHEAGIPALYVGIVRESSDGKKRVILPNGVVFQEDDLDIR